MTLQQLVLSVQEDLNPSIGSTLKEKVLWLARAGKWNEAHELCSDIHDLEGAWLHAMLHRQEGDLANASYWYSLAGKSMPKSDQSFESEWLEMASCLIGN